MENKNFKKTLGLGISSLMAISSLNLAVFAGASQDDQIEENRGEEINLDAAAEENRGEEINLDEAAEENNVDKINLDINKAKLDYIEEFEKTYQAAEKSENLRLKNFYQEKKKMDNRAAIKRNMRQKKAMLKPFNNILIDDETFPDRKFRREVIEILKENNPGHEEEIGEGKIIPIKYVDNVTEIIIYGFNEFGERKKIYSFSRKEEEKVKSLKGIEHFKNLKKLMCDFNDLTNLDITNNLNLTDLSCVDNSLTNLDVANNLNLESLNCGHNKLKELDVAKNVNLTYLNCRYNELPNLNIANNINLEMLDCAVNELKELDVSGLEKLWALATLGNEDLKTIYARGCGKLIDIQVERGKCELIM